MPTDGTDVKACLILCIIAVSCVTKWNVLKCNTVFLSLLA